MEASCGQWRERACGGSTRGGKLQAAARGRLDRTNEVLDRKLARARKQHGGGGELGGRVLGAGKVWGEDTCILTSHGKRSGEIGVMMVRLTSNILRIPSC